MNGDSIRRELLGRRTDWLRRPQLAVDPRTTAGPILVAASAILSWVPFASMTRPGDDPLGLFVGALAIVLMAWSFVLAVRLHVIETLFGGLDRVYAWHRWIGVLSIAAMWTHIRQGNQVQGTLGATAAVAEVGTSLAGFAEVTLYILIVFSAVRWVPYRWWRLTHKLIGVPYIFACFHFITAEKPYSNFSPWGLWFGLIMVAGAVAWVARVVVRDTLRPGAPYIVTAVSRGETVVDVTLAPSGPRQIRRRIGQFAFIKVQSAGMSEPHPFSIASSPDSTELRFVIRARGDWTDIARDRFPVGQTVIVEGAYGRLQLHPRDARPTIWFAGGLGITPFLSAISAGTNRRNSAAPHLFYSTSTRSDAMALNELEAADRTGRIHLHLTISSEAGRLTRQSVETVLGAEGIRGAHVVVCGPHDYAVAARGWSRSLGAHTIAHESFEIRSGVAPDVSRRVKR